MTGDGGDGAPTAAGPAPRGRWLLLLLVAFGLLAGWASQQRVMWLDEVYSIDRSQGGLARVMHINRVSEANPPLYYVWLWAWRGLAGDSQLGIRGLSIALALAGIVLAQRLGRIVLGPGGGLLTAGLLACSGVYFYFAHEARGYMLGLVLSLAQATVGARVLLGAGAEAAGAELPEPSPAGERQLIAAYGVLTLLTGSTLYYSWLGTTAQILAFAAAALLSPEAARLPRLRATAWLLASGLLGLLAFAVEVGALHDKAIEFVRLLDGRGVASGMPRALPELAGQDALNRWLAFPVGLQWAPLGAPAALHAWTAAAWLLIAGGALGAGLALRDPRWRPAGALTLGLAALPWLLLLAVPLRPHRFEGKHLICALPWFCLALAALARMAWQPQAPRALRWLSAALLAAYLGLNLSSVVDQLRSEKEDWPGLWQALAAELRPGDVLLVTPNYIRHPLAHNAPRGAPELLVVFAEGRAATAALWVRVGQRRPPYLPPDEPPLAALVARCADRGQRIWWLRNWSNVAIGRDPALEAVLGRHGYRPQEPLSRVGFAGANGSLHRLIRLERE